MPVTLDHVRADTPIGATLVAGGPTFRLRVPDARRVDQIADPKDETRDDAGLCGTHAVDALTVAWHPQHMHQAHGTGNQISAVTVALQRGTSSSTAASTMAPRPAGAGRGPRGPH
jgi:hypothetical protein